MSITFTSTQVRTDASAQYYGPDTGLPVVTNIRRLIAEAGITTTKTLSEDQLTQTVVDICETNEQVVVFLNCVLDIDMRKELEDYQASKSAGMKNRRTISGVGAPFTITTTYTFPEGTDITSLANQVALHDGLYATNVQILVDSVICTHTYPNENAFNTNRWSDVNIYTDLVGKNITKSHTFTINS